MIEKFSVIILCPDCNMGGLKYTVSTLKTDFPEVPFIAMVGKEAHRDNIRDMEECCRVCVGGKTVTSLIDVGMAKSDNWVLTMTAGSRFRYNIYKKYKYFTKSVKDILFPVVDRKYLFDEASINGIMIHKEGFHDIGNFDGNDNIQETKLYWAGKAIDKGYKFKALVGARLI